MADPVIERAPFSQELARRTKVFGAGPTVPDFFRFVNDYSTTDTAVRFAQAKVTELWNAGFAKFQASPGFATAVTKAEQEILAATPTMPAADAHAAAERKVRSEFRLDFGTVGEVFMKVLRAAVPTTTFISESKALVTAVDETDKNLPANFNTAANLKNNKFLREEQEHFRQFLFVHETDPEKRREHQAELVDITKQPPRLLTLHRLYDDDLKPALATALSDGAAAAVPADSITENNFVQLINNYVKKDDASAERFSTFIGNIDAGLLNGAQKAQIINELKLQPTKLIVDIVQGINGALLGTQKTVADLTPSQFAALFVKQQIVHANPADTTAEKWSLYKLLDGTNPAQLARLLGNIDATTLTADNLFEKILDYIGDPAQAQGLANAETFLKDLKAAVAAGTVTGVTPDDLTKISQELVTLQNARALHSDAALADDYISLPVAFAQNTIKNADGTYVAAYEPLRDAAIAAGATEATINDTEARINQNKNYKLDGDQNPYLAALGDQMRTRATDAGFVLTATLTDHALAEAVLNLSQNVDLGTVQPAAFKEQLFSAFLASSAPNVNSLPQMLNAATRNQIATALGIDPPTNLTPQNLMQSIFGATDDQIAELRDQLNAIRATAPTVPVDDILQQLNQVERIKNITPDQINRLKTQSRLGQFYQRLTAKPAVNAALVTGSQPHKDRVTALTERSKKLAQDSIYPNLRGRAEKVIIYYARMIEQMKTQLAATPAGTPAYEELNQKIMRSEHYLGNLRGYRLDVTRAGMGMTWTQPQWGGNTYIKQLADFFAPSIMQSPDARRSSRVLTNAQALAAHTGDEGSKYTISRTVYNSKANLMCELTRVVDSDGNKGEKLTFVSDAKNYLDTKLSTERRNHPTTGQLYLFQVSEMQTSAAKCIAYACNNGGMLVYNKAADKFEMPPPGSVFDSSYFNGTKDAYGRGTGGMLREEEGTIGATIISALFFPVTLPLNLIGLVGSSAIMAGYNAISNAFTWLTSRNANPEYKNLLPKPFLETFLTDMRGTFYSAKTSATNRLERAFVNYWFQDKLTQGLLAGSHVISEDVKQAHKELTAEGTESKKVYDDMMKPEGQLGALERGFNHLLEIRRAGYATPAEADKHKADDIAFVMEQMLQERGQSIPLDVRQHYEQLLRDQKDQRNAQQEAQAGPRSTVTLNPGR